MTKAVDGSSPQLETAAETETVAATVTAWWLPTAVRVAKWMLTILVISAVALAARESIAALTAQSKANRITLDDVRWGWLGLSGLAYTASLIPSGMVLRRALAALQQPVKLPLVMAAQLVGHLGKYVPGKAMVIVLRASILNRDRTKISIKLSAVAVIIETLNLIAVGAVYASILVAVLETPAWMKWTSGVMAIGAVVGTLPPVLRFALAPRLRARRTERAITTERPLPAEALAESPAEATAAEGTPKRERRRLAGLMQPIRLDWTTDDLVASWFWCTVSWIFTGLSMTAVVLALMPLAGDQSVVSLTLICSAAVMLAFVAGFVSLLPGGAGVREMVLATLLAPMMGPSTALLAAVLARLIQLVVECLLSAAIWALMLRSPPRHADQSLL